MLPFTYRHLEVFTAIARTGNVSIAAERLGMSQSAASAALAELERRSDCPLFDRAGKRLSLNDVGRALLPRAIAALDQAGEIGALLGGRGGGAALRLGATVTIGNFVAPALIARYRDSFPDAAITLDVGNTDRMAARIASFDLDLALVEGECTSPDLDISDWREDMLAVFASPAHPLANQGPIAIDRLLDEAWVVRESGSGTRQALDRAMSHWLPRWRIEIELQHFDAIKAYVGLGGTVGCIARLAIAEELSSGRLVEIPAPDLDLRRRFYILLNHHKYRTAAIHRFIELCRADGGG